MSHVSHINESYHTYKVVHVLGDRVDESWPGEVGRVDELRVRCESMCMSVCVYV